MLPSTAVLLRAPSAAVLLRAPSAAERR